MQLNQALLDFDAKSKGEESLADAQAQAERARERQRQRSELETRLSEARSLQKAYEDAGPVYDVVVWCEQELTAAADSKESKVTASSKPIWRAAVDAKQDGDLSAVKGMTNYRLERQWATFSADDRMNYSVNIYVGSTPNATPLCSIVATAGARTFFCSCIRLHSVLIQALLRLVVSLVLLYDVILDGTHVAGIVAANFPQNPDLNGIAPGAQLVSIKIGDSRVGSGSMETGLCLCLFVPGNLSNRM